MYRAIFYALIMFIAFIAGNIFYTHVDINTGKYRWKVIIKSIFLLAVIILFGSCSIC